MAYKVRCGTCGKSLLLPEGDAGLAVVCLACGTKFVAPPAGAAGDTSVAFAPGTAIREYALDPAGPDVAQVAVANNAFEALGSRHNFEDRPGNNLTRDPNSFGTGPARRRWSPASLSLGAVLLLVLVGVAVAMLRGGRGSENLAELTRISDEAHALVARGDLRGAHQKYRDLDSRAIELGAETDPALQVLAERARADQKAVYAAMLGQLGGTPAPVPDAGSASTGPPTPATTVPAPADPVTDAPVASAVPATPPPIPPRVTQPPPAVPDPDPSAAATTPSPPPGSPTESGATTKLPEAGNQRPLLEPMPEPVIGVTDEQIGQAIQRGIDHLVPQFGGGAGGQLAVGSLDNDTGYACGLNALVVYALLQSGQAVADKRLDVRDPFMRKLLDGMKALKPTQGKVTYARGIRATALALANRPEDRSALKADVRYLLMTHRNGAYHYEGDPEGHKKEAFNWANIWDNSNSQYGLLGVWSGAEVGIEVPGEYWKAVERHWLKCQSQYGTWGYTSGRHGGTMSMTAAGTASLLVAQDYRYYIQHGLRVGRDPYDEALKKSLDWWGEGNHAVNIQSGWWGYTLYGIERVGLASGFKHLGQHDWYRGLAADAISRQKADGSWGNLIDTSYALLFLARGRHPILMNKLRFDRAGVIGEEKGYWANRPRDAANLARFAGRRLERPFNWQVVGIDRPWQDWLDSPILSIASHTAPFFTDAQCDRLRNYVEAGGLLYLQADGDEPAAFDAFANDLAKRLFPQYPMGDLPAAHPLFNALYKLDPPPQLKAVTNGARVLILYSQADVAKSWQMRDEKAKEGLFNFGVNLLVYAAGKRELRNRLESPYVSAPDGPAPLGSVRVARVTHGGDWDPEPGAWRRFARWFVRQTGTELIVKEVPLAALSADDLRVAHITGTAAYQPTEAEVSALRAYVEAGGVLLIDACGGSSAFADSMRGALGQAFPDTAPRPLRARHPLLSAGPAGMDDLRIARMRPYALEKVGNSSAAGLRLLSAGKGHVVISSVDVTSGLLGTQTWGIFGYQPAYAQSLLKNLIFWTIDGQPTDGE